ncbi:unnamed protein product [Mytilus edulis]|uniref:Uncharacterized protein n=1 Tax=Mytilus edulis TaxID=6550 RepID=A0A8S3UF06_MYTED|nr:unnamed protein product [Mytilus edulis]
MEDEPDLIFIGASLLVLVVSSILFIVGLSTPYFSETTQDRYKTYSGLWKHCLDYIGDRGIECEETVNRVKDEKVVFISIGIAVYPDIARDVVPGHKEPYYGSSYTLCVVAMCLTGNAEIFTTSEYLLNHSWKLQSLSFSLNRWGRPDYQHLSWY